MCYEGIVSLQAHNGDTYSAYPWHQTLLCLWLAIDSGSSTSQSTKHRMTLFLYVVSSPVAPPTSIGIIANELKTGQRYKKISIMSPLFRFFFDFFKTAIQSTGSWLENREFQKILTTLTQQASNAYVHWIWRGWVSTVYTHPDTHLATHPQISITPNRN